MSDKTTGGEMSTETKLTVRVTVDRKAALLAGRVLGETVDVEVGPEDLGPELWRELIEALDTRAEPPRVLGSPAAIQVADGGVEALKTAVSAARTKREAQEAKQRAGEARKRQEAETELAEYEKEVTTWLALKPRWRDVTCYAQPDLQERSAVPNAYRWQGVEPIPVPRCGWLWDVPDLVERRDVLQRQVAEAEQLDREAVDEENAKRLAAARPDLERIRAAEQADEDRKRQEREAATAARAAKRLQTGYWERETPTYNERRYGKYWCARVTFPAGPKAVYEWGESTGTWGKAGLLRVACRPGDVIAWGQKDMRRTARSEHHVLRMREDGRMEDTDLTAAWRTWQEKAGAR